MLYEDRLYGKVQFPTIIAELLETPIVKRLRGISQGVLPEECHVVRLPSRHEHCIGVSILALRLLHANPDMKQRTQRCSLLLASALLHDAGNPCLSHLGETFLQRMTGMNGETYLARMLSECAPACSVLRKHGLEPAQVVACVTGKTPFSRALHGSMDIDNVDNVNRFWTVSGNGQIRFNGQLIARSFRWQEGDESWYLLDEAREQAMEWRRTRKNVYQLIYGEPHLGVAAMVWHAVDMAYKSDLLTEDFFKLTDTQALDWLEERGGDIEYVVHRARSHQLYESVWAIETTSPSSRLRKICLESNAREIVESRVRELTGVPERAFCCYAGRGKESRKIDMPFVYFSEGARWEHYDEEPAVPMFRLRGYLDHECSDKRDAVAAVLAGLVGVEA